MPVNIQLDEDISSPPDLDLLQSAAVEALRLAGAKPDAEITIVLTDDQELCGLNRQYLGIDAPTDVLSFPADFIDPDSHHPYLGDILISVERAVRQAEQHNHSAQKELLLLVVHGVLHLLGHDHAEQAEKDRMWALQDQILSHVKGENLA
jgi:probable rRNA maturation factor